MTTQKAALVRYRVTGIDCTDGVFKFEKVTRSVPCMAEVCVSLTSQTVSLRRSNGDTSLVRLEDTIAGPGFYPARLDASAGSADDLAADLGHVTSGYQRALWIVVLLNVRCGANEIGRGLLADLQALKADALAFLGDGLISFLGLLAIGWSLLWRARAALTEGIFPTLLGIGMVGTMIYRTLVQDTPEAGLMSGFGTVAHVVNVTAALVLLPHHSVDANAITVWLFSRYNALGNLAVVIAAGLVAWGDSSWPDLAVALVISRLLLHLSWEIIRDARRVLADQTVQPSPVPAA